MPAKRKYNVKGTNDFVVLAAIFFFLCLWAIKDAWYPSEKVLKKHPRELAASFEVSGVVDQVLVDVGDTLGEGQSLMTLRTDRVEKEYEATKSEYSQNKAKFEMMKKAAENAYNNGASDNGLEEIEGSRDAAEKAMKELQIKVKELKGKLDLSELKSEKKGTVRELKAGKHTMVESGEVVVLIDPKDHFYLFNKSLAIFSFFAFWVFLAIHIFAR